MHPFIVEELIADRQAQALSDAHHGRLVRAAIAKPPPVARPPLRPRWRHRLSVGTLALLGALGAFASSPAESGPGPSTSRIEVKPTTLVGLRAVASERVSYEPGASRSWSPGPQLVGVKVRSGRLTVYGVDGERRTYAAGEGYAAGWATYRTVNETDEPVETVVTNHVRP